MKLVALGAGSAVCPLLPQDLLGTGCLGLAGPALSDHEALAYEKLEDRRVRCLLCPWKCEVADGQRGACGVRENQGGVYKTLVYAYLCTRHVDPIEKKPFFHFLPGTRSFSIATVGCNVECKFCQNWQISQARPEQVRPIYAPPVRVARLARQANCRSIAHTYSEPTISYEYMLDCAREAKKLSLHGVMVSNGFINPAPMKELCKVLSAVKIDLKSFSEQFYRKYVGGQLKPVLRTLELLRSLAMHTEIVTLLIPGLNDSRAEIKAMSKWIRKTLGPDVPLHFSRFHPAYRMTNLSPTPVSTLERAHTIAREEGIHYVYVGNVPGHRHESTFCHGCGKEIISRYGYHIGETHLKDGKCAFCGSAIPGVWEGAGAEGRGG